MTSTTKSDALVVLCTAPTGDGHAARLARGLVDQRLAACVNILPSVRSIYRYAGEIHDDAEAQLVIKTKRARFDPLLRWLEREHPYDVPEIIALPVDRGAPAYLAWVDEQTTLDD